MTSSWAPTFSCHASQLKSLRSTLTAKQAWCAPYWTGTNHAILTFFLVDVWFHMGCRHAVQKRHLVVGLHATSPPWCQAECSGVLGCGDCCN